MGYFLAQSILVVIFLLVPPSPTASLRIPCFLQIWVRNYQILEQQADNALQAHELKKEGQANSTSLVEIGPRFVLNPIRIFKGSFGGPTLYQNPSFVSPNTIRAIEKRKKGAVYKDRKISREKSKERKEQLVVPEDPLDSVFK